MVPEVGRESIAGVRASIDAMAELTRRVIETGAETVILISPHARLEVESFVAYAGPNVYGDFTNFQAPGTEFSARVDGELLTAITRAAASENYSLSMLDDDVLDHGTAVPLYFLLRNGWQGQVVALGYSFLSNHDHLRFGSCIAKAVDQLGRRVAFVASGDLSHRLKPEAPAGYNPSAHRFDEEVIDALRVKCAGTHCRNRSRIATTRRRMRVSIDARCDWRGFRTAVELRGDELRSAVRRWLSRRAID